MGNGKWEMGNNQEDRGGQGHLGQFDCAVGRLVCHCA